MSSGSAFPGETVQTGTRPAGSLSPGLRWLQTSWQRRWAAPFAAEGKGRREGAGKGEHNSKAGRDEIKRRKGRRLGNGGVPGWQGNKRDVLDV